MLPKNFDMYSELSNCVLILAQIRGEKFAIARQNSALEARWRTAERVPNHAIVPRLELPLPSP